MAKAESLRWTIAGLLFLSTGLNYLDRQTLSILATTIQEDLKIDDMGYARITSYFLFSYTIMYAVSGRLVDFLGTRRSLALAVSGWSLAGILHGVAHSAGQLAACRLVLGTFESANFPAGIKAVAEWFPVKLRALGIGIFAAGGSFGAAVAAPLVSSLALAYGWRLAFVVVGALGFVWMAAWLIVYQPAARHPRLTAEERAGFEREADAAGGKVTFGLWALLASRRTWGCILVRVFTDPIVYFVSFWIPKYLTTAHGFSLADIGRYAWIPFVALSGGNILGGSIASWLVERGGGVDRVRKGLMLSASLLVLGSGALVATATNPTAALLGITGISLGHGLWGNLAVPSEVFPSHSVAFVTGLAGTLGGVAGILSQFGIAWAAGNQGYGLIFGVFSVCPLLAYLAVKILVGRLGEISFELAAPVEKKIHA
ncbi:MAG: MFS transporter [Verrucomicrobia bacterium]|nr:MFS transporter [Verrucomicrobiota bacterium]